MPARGARRTFLLLPANAPAKAQKAATLGADVVILDLEDGVPEAHKQAARDGLIEAISSIDFGPREVMVRINASTTAHWQADVAALRDLAIGGIFLPKVEAADEVVRFRRHLSGFARRHKAIEVIATVETARGLLEVERIAAAGGGLAGLFFGSGDYALSTGIEISRETLDYPRSRIAVAAAANGLQAIDVAYFKDVKDPSAAEADARDARAHGFSGKVVFHPNQIAAVNAVFTPSADEIERALRIVAAFEQSKGSGQGVFLLDGEFVAIDIVLMAQRTLARAAATGVLATENERGS